MSEVRIGSNPEELGIQIPEGKEYSSRDFKVRYCPGCEEAGKRNFNDSSLSVNMDKKVANCHKCGTKFSWGSPRDRANSAPVSYDLPEDKLQPVGREVMKFIKDRGIDDEDIINACVMQEMRYDKTVKKEVPWLAFPYYKLVDGERVLINVKYRDIKDKRFAQSKNGEPSLWLSHMAVNHKKVVITEGEFDTLAIMSALGVEYMKENSIMITSMNSGAINERDKDVDGKLKGFSLSYKAVIDCADVVVLATDGDPQGDRLKEELKKRIDKEVRVMRFGEFKDSNALLENKGKEAVISALEGAEIELPDGVSRLEDFEAEMWAQYNNGLNKGTSTYFDPVDRVWKWRPTEVTVVSGYANEGKTTLFLHLAMIACVFEPMRRFLVFSPENIPQHEFYEDLIHSFMGLPSDITIQNRMTPEQYKRGMEFMNEHFLLLYPTSRTDDGHEEENFTVSTIISKVIETKRTDNITDVIIDPYNMVEHDLRISDREDLYISKFMTKLKRLALRCDVSVTLIAHQLTPRPDPKTGNYPRPSMYNIKGGGTFADKADNVITMWRPYRRKQYEDHIEEDHKKFVDGIMGTERDKADILKSLMIMESEKIKKQKLVAQPGEVIFLYKYKSARFSAIDQHNPEDTVGSSPLITGAAATDYEQQIAEIEEEYKPNVKDIKIEDIKFGMDNGDVPF
jgi:twinkle protein